jgi:hypothetical protein
MTRIQLALGDRITAVFLDGPVRAIAWGAALFTALSLAAGWRLAVCAIAAGTAGAAVWWGLSKWRCRS